MSRVEYPSVFKKGPFPHRLHSRLPETITTLDNSEQCSRQSRHKYGIIWIPWKTLVWLCRCSPGGNNCCLHCCHSVSLTDTLIVTFPRCSSLTYVSMNKRRSLPPLHISHKSLSASSVGHITRNTTLPSSMPTISRRNLTSSEIVSRIRFRAFIVFGEIPARTTLFRLRNSVSEVSRISLFMALVSASSRGSRDCFVERFAGRGAKMSSSSSSDVKLDASMRTPTVGAVLVKIEHLLTINIINF